MCSCTDEGNNRVTLTSCLKLSHLSSAKAGGSVTGTVK